MYSLLFYIVKWINSKNIPVKTPIKYSNIIILKLTLGCLFVLHNTKTPTPAPTNNPESNVEIVIPPDKYNCVRITEEAQFGINPIIPAIIGPIKGT